MRDKEQSDNGQLEVWKEVNTLEVIQSAEQAKAVVSISNSLSTLTNWLTTGGLTEILTGTAKAKGVSDMLAALLQHDGRNALDARHIEQNAVEITHHLEAVFDKLVSHLKDKNEGKLDPDLHDAELAFKEFKKDSN